MVGPDAIQLLVLEAAPEVGILLAELKGHFWRIEGSCQKPGECRGFRPNDHPLELQPILPARIVGIGDGFDHPKPHVEPFPDGYCRASARLMTMR
jgi:hypothetical protein